MYFKLRSGWKAGASLAYRHPRHHRHHRHHRHDKSSEVSVLEHPLCKGTLSNHFFLRIRARAASLVSLYRCAPLRTCRHAHQGPWASVTRSLPPLAGLVVAFRPSEQEH